MRNPRLLLVLGTVLIATPVLAQPRQMSAKLRSFEEVPAISSPAAGNFTATVNAAGTEIEYELTYDNLDGAVTQAHLHIGQRGVNGGIMIFLCSNLPNPPAGTQSCPASGTIEGTIDASDVIGPSGQGIEAGGLAEPLKAMRNGVAYANVHSDKFPGGEIRGQLRFGRGGSN